MTRDRFMSVDELAGRLDVGRDTVYEMCRRGDVPAAINVGSGRRARWRLLRRPVEHWLATGCDGTGCGHELVAS